MKAGVVYRLGAILLVVALTGVVIYLERPREFLLTYCSIGAFLAALLGMASFQGAGTRNSFLVLASTSLIASLLDPITYLAGRPSGETEGTWNSTYHYGWDPALGIALPANVVATSRKAAGGKVVYDVTYTIDGNAHRKTLGSTDPAADSVVFVGGSDIFGEGVQDSETLPQQFSDLTGRKYNVANFGVSTFGIHQPLRSMELGQLAPAMTGSKRYIVYVGIPGHAQRVRGLRGPSYGLEPDGSVKYLGQTQSFWEVFAVAIANRSLFLRTFIVIPTMSGLSDDAAPLYVALVKRAGEVAREKYKAKLIVIFWDEPPDRLGAQIMALFDKAKTSYVRLSTVLPDLRRDYGEYILSADGHPNALADRLIAQYLARHLDDIPPQP